MNPLERSDILDQETYEAQRHDTMMRVKALREPRKILLGEHLDFLFETPETLRYQVHEALRAGKDWSEGAIERELAAHNARLGGENELGCTLLIEIEDMDERDRRLAEWTDLPQHVFAAIDVGRHVPGVFDPKQVREDRISSVQYLKFDCQGSFPIGLACTRPGMELRQPLSDAQRAALAEDLGLER